jgi:hypothetical protein
MTPSCEKFDDSLILEKPQLKAGNGLDHFLEKAQREIQGFRVVERREATGEELSHRLGRPLGKQLVFLCMA